MWCSDWHKIKNFTFSLNNKYFSCSVRKKSREHSRLSVLRQSMCGNARFAACWGLSEKLFCPERCRASGAACQQCTVGLWLRRTVYNCMVYSNTVQQQRRKVGSELEALSHNMRPSLGFRKAYCPANTHTQLYCSYILTAVFCLLLKRQWPRWTSCGRIRYF